MALDLSKIREEADKYAKDLTKPTTGGGDRQPPAEGPTRLRLTGYVETGIHTTQFQGNPKRKPRVELVFELSGPKHEPIKGEDGTLYPQRIIVNEVVGTHQKNGYIKLFNVLNTDGTATNYLGLLMEKAWRGVVSHRKYKGKDGSDRVAANLKKDGAWSIASTEFEDPETGELRKLAVPPAIGPLRVFLWDTPDLEQWDSLLDYQKDKIRTAENFVGSPIYELLTEAGRTEELKVSKKDGEEQGSDESADDEGEEAAPEVKKETPAPAPAAAAKPKAATKAKPTPKKEASKAPDADPLQGL